MDPRRLSIMVVLLALFAACCGAIAKGQPSPLVSISGFEDSVHGKSGVSCSDCHNNRAGGEDVVCAPCHLEILALYRKTPHGSRNAPRCTDCHSPHGVKPYRELSAQERIATCTRCHHDYLARHRWLPNARLHFSHLECTACHSPESRKGIIFDLVLRTDGGKRRLVYEDFGHVLPVPTDTKSLVDIDGDSVASSEELAELFVRLRQRLGKGISLEGAILVTVTHHEFTATRHREKECTICHSKGAPFYDSMYLRLPSIEGPVLLPVKETILSALPLALSVDLLMLGEEKIRYSDVARLISSGPKERAKLFRELGLRWVDFSGVTMALLLIVAMAFHATLRVLTRR